MTATQLDLFAPDAKTRRLVDGLTCIRDSIPDAMHIVIHLTYWRLQAAQSIGASGDWAYSIRKKELRFEHEADWWRGAHARGESYGWDRTPAHHITWAELAEQIGDDPRRAELINWSRSLPEPAWPQLTRPHELWPDAKQWDPDCIAIDHQHPGWDQRHAAWRTLRAILTDATTRLDTPFDLETTP